MTLEEVQGNGGARVTVSCARCGGRLTIIRLRVTPSGVYADLDAKPGTFYGWACARELVKVHPEAVAPEELR